MIYLQREELFKTSQCSLFGNEEIKLMGVETLHGLFPSEQGRIVHDSKEALVGLKAFSVLSKGSV